MGNVPKKINTERSSRQLIEVEPIESRIEKYIKGNLNFSKHCDLIDPVDARFKEKPISKINDEILSIALTKMIVDTLEYFGSENTGMAAMLVDDIKSEFGRWTLVDIFKAINMGRRSGKDIFGKLNASHFIKWIRDYDLYLGSKIVEKQKNVAHTRKVSIQSLNIFDSELQKLKNTIKENAKKKKIEKDKKLPEKKKDFQVFEIEKPTERMILIREWRDIQGEKESLEDFLKSKGNLK